MNKKYCLLILILSQSFFAQISFEKGYFIKNDGKYIVCFIKNIDWKNNPTKFDYKLSENSNILNEKINNVKEFGIDSASKYIRNTIKIDRSTSNINKLSAVKDPEFKNETIFLKVLIEGKANLFVYEDGNLRKYFFNVDNGKINQLIFKLHKTKHNKVAKNESFKKQIWNNLKCQNINIKDIKNLEYKKKQLINLFIDFNNCRNSNYIDYETKQKKKPFNLNFRIGYNLSNLKVVNTISDTQFANFDSGSAFRIGLEAEFILPFNKNKWSIILEPTYQYFKSETEAETQSATLNYSAIELPIGIRHYFYINKNSKLFVNANIVSEISNNSNILLNSGSNIDINKSKDTTLGLELGLKHKNKYTLAFRYQKTDGLSNDIPWNYANKTFSLLFGYSLF